jgi:hypothetical protein
VQSQSSPISRCTKIFRLVFDIFGSMLYKNRELPRIRARKNKRRTLLTTSTPLDHLSAGQYARTSEQPGQGDSRKCLA